MSQYRIVTDAPERYQFTITQPAVPIDGSVSVTNVNCFGGSTGRIDLSVTGGVVPYTFLWNNGAVTEDIINIPGGNYSVVITDANGCNATVTATVTQPASALAGTASVINVLCFGGTTGSVNLTVTGGTAPYSFIWNNGAIDRRYSECSCRTVLSNDN